MSTQLSLLHRAMPLVREPSLELVVSHQPVVARAVEQGVVGPAAAAHVLGISRRSLDRVLRLLESHGPPTLVPTAAGVGTNRHHWRWTADELTDWWKEVNAWRASTSGMAAGESDGVTPMGRRDVASAPTARRRKRSAATSSGQSRRAGGGSLVTLARSLTSGK